LTHKTLDLIFNKLFCICQVVNWKTKKPACAGFLDCVQMNE